MNGLGEGSLGVEGEYERAEAEIQKMVGVRRVLRSFGYATVTNHFSDICLRNVG